MYDFFLNTYIYILFLQKSTHANISTYVGLGGGFGHSFFFCDTNQIRRGGYLTPFLRCSLFASKIGHFQNWMPHHFTLFPDCCVFLTRGKLLQKLIATPSSYPFHGDWQFGLIKERDPILRFDSTLQVSTGSILVNWSWRLHQVCDMITSQMLSPHYSRTM